MIFFRTYIFPRTFAFLMIYFWNKNYLCSLNCLYILRRLSIFSFILFHFQSFIWENNFPLSGGSIHIVFCWTIFLYNFFNGSELVSKTNHQIFVCYMIMFDFRLFNYFSSCFHAFIKNTRSSYFAILFPFAWSACT